MARCGAAGSSTQEDRLARHGDSQQPVRIIVGGDIAPVGRAQAFLAEGRCEAVFGEASALFQTADLSIGNLECPLTMASRPIEKVGPCLRAAPGCARGLASAGLNVLCLANNHILDFGAQGLADTTAACREAGITTVGGGRNLAEAQTVLIRSVRGTRIGICAMAEHEFSIATANAAGANPLSIPGFARTARTLRKSVDFLLVLVHGGIEHFPYPHPWQRDVCQFLVEEGADAVVCQHSHCPGATEMHRDRLIAYGQGNLLFDMKSSTEWWNKGYLIEFSLTKGTAPAFRFIPYAFDTATTRVELLKGTEQECFLDRVRAYSSDLDDPEKMAAIWTQFCASQENRMLSSVYGIDRLSRGLLRMSRILKYALSRRSRLLLANLIRCESHREVLAGILDENGPRYEAA